MLVVSVVGFNRYVVPIGRFIAVQSHVPVTQFIVHYDVFFKFLAVWLAYAARRLNFVPRNVSQSLAQQLCRYYHHLPPLEQVDGLTPSRQSLIGPSAVNHPQCKIYDDIGISTFPLSRYYSPIEQRFGASCCAALPDLHNMRSMAHV